jgi:acylphosphatase
MASQRVRVLIKGKVQGVFFRQALKVKLNKRMSLVMLKI